jgi:hypothetical protein
VAATKGVRDGGGSLSAHSSDGSFDDRARRDRLFGDGGHTRHRLRGSAIRTAVQVFFGDLLLRSGGLGGVLHDDLLQSFVLCIRLLVGPIIVFY